MPAPHLGAAAAGGTTQWIPAALQHTQSCALCTEAQAFLSAAVSSLLFSFLVDAG